jgi:hypothetical protein
LMAVKKVEADWARGCDCCCGRYYTGFIVLAD